MSWGYLPDLERGHLSSRLSLMGYGSYADYLRTGQWSLSRRRLGRGYCERCGSTAALVLHHMTYARLGAERPDDVCTLCPRCHHHAHAQARRTGSLYLTDVLEARGRRPAREKQLGAQDVACPVCRSGAGEPCAAPSGEVMGREHRERGRRNHRRQRSLAVEREGRAASAAESPLDHLRSSVSR